MAQQKDSGQQLINLLLIGVGAYLLWEFVISPMISSAQTSASGAAGGYCYDQNGNPIYCPSGYPAGTVLITGTTTQSNVCYDQNGQVITCPSGAAAGSTVNTGTQTGTQTQQTQQTQRTQIPVSSRMSTVTAGARVSRAQQIAALQSTRASGSGGQAGGGTGTRGIGGITPSWPAGGGPAFNAFIPAGMTFGGANAFGQPAWGALETPLSKLVQ